MVKGNDNGFSLVEVVIAMFLLTVIALAILPLTIAAVELSVDNRVQARANAYAESQIAAVRASFPNDATTSTCASLAARVRELAGDTSGGTTLPIDDLSFEDDLVDAGLNATVSVDGCAAGLAAVGVTIVVGEEQSGRTLTSLRTRIVVAP